ncbi:MAG: RNA polymerase sigma factor [Dysgonamonadaceae bacterium]|jgi:RNA polymerase sigma-70 factor (ECF subfamily)|nr:RNA polymerase sigma factor [Dysgonamonadaceae bacterium]
MDEFLLKTLIERCLKNEHPAFRRIVEHFQQGLYATVFKIICNEEDAKDIVQETFIRAWGNLASYNPKKRFSTWLYAIAIHLCYDKLKSEKHRFIVLDSHEIEFPAAGNIETDLIVADLGAIISKLVEQLTPKQQIVFTLRYLEGMETDEIIQTTQMSGAKIKSNLFLARKTICKKLEKLI